MSLIDKIARVRGLRMRGGGVDREKAARVLLQDYRDGLLGRISLETPSTRSVMLAAERAAKETPPAVSEDDRLAGQDADELRECGASAGVRT